MSISDNAFQIHIQFLHNVITLSLLFSFSFSKSLYCGSNVASLPTHKPTTKILKLFSSSLLRSTLRWIGSLIHTRLLFHNFHFNFHQIIQTNLIPWCITASSSITIFIQFPFFFYLPLLFHLLRHIILFTTQL